MKKLNVVGKDEYGILKKAYQGIKKKIPYVPDVAIVLGSGLGDFAKNLKVDKEISFSEIDSFPGTTNKAHKGKYVFARIGSVNVVCMQGRIHYYEGYSLHETIRPIRLLKLMGVKTVILTNVSGGINKTFKSGDLMLIKDHISFFLDNPLRGQNIDELGTRFPDMTDPYDEKIRKIVKKVAKANKIPLKEGVYVQTQGPTFETAAEIRFLKTIGADAVAMSLAIETIAARHAGMNVCGISMITNMATGLAKIKQSDEDVRKNAEKNRSKLEKLLLKVVPEIV